jgi:uncharacterized repeat protein (TIGR03803 family)
MVMIEMPRPVKSSKKNYVNNNAYITPVICAFFEANLPFEPKQSHGQASLHLTALLIAFRQIIILEQLNNTDIPSQRTKSSKMRTATKAFIVILLSINCMLPVTASAQYTKLLDFDGTTTNGSNPQGSLITDGTFMYGMTQNGGANNLGTIFKIMPDGTGYVKLFDFDGINGKYPAYDLAYDGTFIYGTTGQGGANNFGTLFKIMPDGTGFVKLLDFDGTSNGGYPVGTPFFDGTFLYGMTEQGGINNLGVIYKIMPDGTGFTKLLDFDGSNNGSYPSNSLISDGTFLYGMTTSGGANNFGTIFRIMPDGTAYTKLLDFSTPNGEYPYGSLYYDGTFLYGIASEGGTGDFGTIFKLMPDGTGFVKLLDFDGTYQGKWSGGSLIASGPFLYGMTFEGGANDMGTVFKIKPDGTGFVKLLDFDGTNNGAEPIAGSLISDGTFLYGMTAIGGTNNFGTVFKLQYCTPVIGTDVVAACGSYTWIDGNTYTASNNTATYNMAGASANGCDSLVTLNLTVNNPDVTVTTSSATLTANATGAAYQWLDCTNNFAVIPGATNQSFTPAANGNYAVAVTQNSCTDTSSCNNITGIGIAEHTANNMMFVSPNPSSGIFNVESSTLNASYIITDITGRVVASGQLTGKQTSIDLSNAQSGVYILKVDTKAIRLVKQ